MIQILIEIVTSEENYCKPSHRRQMSGMASQIKLFIYVENGPL